jgi:hypothetical protein
MKLDVHINSVAGPLALSLSRDAQFITSFIRFVSSSRPWLPALPPLPASPLWAHCPPSPFLSSQVSSYPFFCMSHQIILLSPRLVLHIFPWQCHRSQVQQSRLFSGPRVSSFPLWLGLLITSLLALSLLRSHSVSVFSQEAPPRTAEFPLLSQQGAQDLFSSRVHPASSCSCASQG